ncbi:MAG: protein BatD [Candidatus Hydrogenedentes bacterium]|nr:protein BatD [Candidatus Hydrogenedentota bacterium]
MAAAGQIAAAVLSMLAASDPEVAVRLDRDTIEVNQPFLIIVEARGSNVGEPQIPDVPGLIIEQSPRRREDRLNMINLDMTQIKVRAYAATPTRTGAIQLPAIPVLIDKQEVKSAPLTFTVAEGAPLQRPPGPPDKPAPPSRPADSGEPAGERRGLTLDEAVFLVAEVDKKEVFQGEPVQLNLSLWAFSGVGLGEQPLAATYPSTTGFYALPQVPEDIGPEVQVRDGWEYVVSRQRQVLYPTTTGTLTIGPWEWTGVARVFTGFMYERKRVARSTAPIEITVRPLPERPKGFSGAVGTFHVKAELTENRVIQGTPTKLMIRITGRGNPNAIGAPELPAMDDVYVAPPEKATQSLPLRGQGPETFERTFTYAITPIAAGTLVIPPVEFCYFEPAAAAYKVERVGPFTVEVLETPEAQSNRVVGIEARPGPGSVDVLGLDILGPVPAPSELRRRQTLPLAVGITTALPPLAYAILALYVARKRRFAADTGLARSSRARTKALKRLRAARHAAEPADELFHVLAGFVADKFDVPEAGLTSADARRLLEEHEVMPETTDNLTKVLRKCERARYAGDPLTEHEVDALFHGAAAGMSQLDAARKGGAKS